MYRPPLNDSRHRLRILLFSSIALGILLAGRIQPVFADTQYVGYASANLGGSTCGLQCLVPSNTNFGLGSSIRAPASAQSIVSVFVQVGGYGTSTKFATLVIVAFTGVNPVTKTISCLDNALTGLANNCAYVCDVPTSCSTQTYKAVAVVSLTATTFVNGGNTVTLTTPVLVSANQWIAVLFMFNDNLNAVIMACKSNCGSGGGLTISGVTADTEMDFTSGSPTVGTTYNAITNDIAGALGGFMVGATFNVLGTGGLPSTSSPATYPCCAPVTTTTIQGTGGVGSALRVSDIDSAPIIALFFILFALTLGSYIVVRAVSKQRKPPAQYEINI